MNKYGKSKLYIILRPIVSVLFKIVFHPKIIGRHNLSDDCSFVLAGNHISNLDPLLLMSSTKREIHFLAKSELFKGVKGIIFSNLGLIPVDRSKKNPDAIKSAMKYLENDEVVLVFPEGTTEKGRGLMEFKMGAVKIASDVNKKIVPFVIQGKYRIFGESICIKFLKPIRVSNNLDKENNRLRNIIKSALKENDK